MKTALINGKRKNITYKTSSELYTRYVSPLNKKAGQYGADIYTVNDDESYIVVVATSHNGSTLKSTTLVIKKDEYLDICNLYNPSDAFDFHNELMMRMGFK